MRQETKEKVCFVVMGFNKKMDYKRSKEIDLDVIYHKVIKKVFQEDFPEYTLIRADEIAGSQMIDISMYALIMDADLVIADLTTMNENAVYELGVRHALKPWSTIIMMQEGQKDAIPFDIHNCRILMYEDYEDSLNEQQAEAVRENLRAYIENAQPGAVDSPMFTMLPQNQRPEVVHEEYQRVVENFRRQRDKNSIAALIEGAKKKMAGNQFTAAAGIWKKLHEKMPGDAYVQQQYALAVYKSKEPDEKQALENGLKIMENLNPDSSLDLETLGITGAIHKRLFKLTEGEERAKHLEDAIRYYQKGYIIKNDYYNGENFAFCLLEKAKTVSREEAESLKFRAKEVFQSIVKMLEDFVSNQGENKIDYWMYATLSTSCYCIGDMEGYKKYRERFYQGANADWEKETYEVQLAGLMELL